MENDSCVLAASQGTKMGLHRFSTYCRVVFTSSGRKIKKTITKLETQSLKSFNVESENDPIDADIYAKDDVKAVKKVSVYNQEPNILEWNEYPLSGEGEKNDLILVRDRPEQDEKSNYVGKHQKRCRLCRETSHDARTCMLKNKAKKSGGVDTRPAYGVSLSVTSSTSEPIESEQDGDISSVQRRKRRCRLCGETGHYMRTCMLKDGNDSDIEFIKEKNKGKRQTFEMATLSSETESRWHVRRLVKENASTSRKKHKCLRQKKQRMAYERITL